MSQSKTWGVYDTWWDKHKPIAALAEILFIFVICGLPIMLISIAFDMESHNHAVQERRSAQIQGAEESARTYCQRMGCTFDHCGQFNCVVFNHAMNDYVRIECGYGSCKYIGLEKEYMFHSN